MYSTPAYRTLIAATTIALLTPLASASKPETAAIEAKVAKFYQQLSEGDMEGAFGFIDSGSNGFLPKGMLIEIRNEAAHAHAAADAASKHEAGKVIALTPKHLNVRLLGDSHAVVGFYVDGSITEEGVSSEVMRRVSFVLGKRGDEWKVVHWHSSELQREDAALAAK